MFFCGGSAGPFRMQTALSSVAQTPLEELMWVLKESKSFLSSAEAGASLRTHGN